MERASLSLQTLVSQSVSRLDLPRPARDWPAALYAISTLIEEIRGRPKHTCKCFQVLLKMGLPSSPAPIACSMLHDSGSYLLAIEYSLQSRPQSCSKQTLGSS